MTFRLAAFRLLSLVAIGVCVALTLDALLPAPAFCGFRAGCEEVTRSALGSIAGVPLSLLGLIAFIAFYVISLFPESWLGRNIGALAIVAGLIGLALVAVQVFVLKRTCPFCLIVDICAILMAAVELGWPQPSQAVTETGEATAIVQLSVPRRGLWIVVAVFVAAGPIAWAVVKPPRPVPDEVRALWVEGRINVVEITDFACPHCRATHPALVEFLERHADEVHFVRVIAPLEHHANSRPAALAYLFAVEQGRGEEMADALFSAGDHSPEALLLLAEAPGLDADAMRGWINDPAHGAQLDATLSWVEATGTGLPQIWINEIGLVGEQTESSLEAAFKRARR